MSTIFGEDGQSGNGLASPSRINFAWLGESWKLFTDNAFVWIPAVLLAVYLPLMVDGVVSWIWYFSNAAILHEPLNPFKAMHAIHAPVRIGLTLLNLVWGTFMWAGLNRTAVKQVTGEAIRLSDVFSGAQYFGNMLIYGIIYGLLMSAATGLLLLPALYIGGLLLIGFPLIATGSSVLEAMGKSAKAIGTHRIQAAMLAFIAGAMVALSWLVFGLGPIVTLPMYVLISALAYRDLVYVPSTTYIEKSIDEIIKSDATTLAVLDGPRISLSGEPIEEDGAEVR